MMKHINDIEMQQYIAGKLSTSGKEKVQMHLVKCQECSQRLRKAAELWDTLGQWDIDTAGHDVADSVIALAKKENPTKTKNDNIIKLWKKYLPAVLRVAASIIIAIGVGYKLGKYSVTGFTPKTAVSSSSPEYLSALSLEWSSELAWFVLDNQSNGSQQQ